MLMLELLGAIAIAQSPGTAFTYQGRLEHGAAPAQGLHDMRFRLWLSDNDPNDPVGPVICKDNLPVRDGLFATELDFGAVFTGFPLWLEIEVRADASSGNCGGGAFTRLAPRQPLTPAPFAAFATSAQTAGLRLPFDGETNSTLALDLESTAVSAQPAYAGIFRIRSSANDSRAVTGLATGGNGTTYGVFGRSNSAAGIGVHGESFGLAGVRGVATNASGVNYGVYGETQSASGYGGYFIGPRNYFSGSVGIGTPSPTNGKLEVSATTFGVYSQTSSTADGAGVYGKGRYGILGVPNASSGFGGVFTGSGTFGEGNALWVTGVARIGDRLTIGGGSLVTTPAARLHIESGEDAALAGGGYAVLGPTGGMNIVVDDNEIMARDSGATSTLFLNHNGGDVAVSGAGSGRLGIGTATPQHRLDVAGNIHLRDGLYFGAGVVNPLGFTSNVLSFGDPGVGEDHIAYVDGEFFFQDSPGGGDNQNPSIYAADFVTNSDIRIKKDVEPLTGALDAVSRIQGLRYRFDGTKVDPACDASGQSERLHLGFSAQALAEVVPEAVYYARTFDRYGVSYGALVPLLTEAIKEQQAQLEQLRRTIDELRADVEELKRRSPR